MHELFSYRDGVLHAEDVSLADLAAQYGTPLYVYSRGVLEAQYRALRDGLGSLGVPLTVCYAMKANSNPHIGALLATLGAGADVVSGGELFLARRMGFPDSRIVFAGVGKTAPEIAQALDGEGIRAFHVESAQELAAIAQIAAALGKIARIAVRVNPDIEAHTHPYITTGTKASKFGVPPEEALALTRYAAAHPHLQPVGLHAHIGSQLEEVQPIADSAARLLELWDALAAEGIALQSLDIGGGLGIRYRPHETPQGPADLGRILAPLLQGRKIELAVEPGRFLAGPAGLLLTSVTYVKDISADASQRPTALAIVDAGMNDLLRPALYGAWHPLLPVQEALMGDAVGLEVAGPVCESSDFLAHARELARVPQPGDVLALMQAGAYGFSMASQYNSRLLPAEVLVSGATAQLIRPRQTYDDLL